MKKNLHQRRSVETAIIEAIASDLPNVVTSVAKKSKISRQAVLRYLSGLIAQGLVAASGNTRARNYSLPVLVSKNVVLDSNDGLEEHTVYVEHVQPVLRDLRVPTNVEGILYYGVTEMVNNAIDHSECKHIWIEVTATAHAIQILVRDDGVGIFKKIRQAAGLELERDAIFELHKGKFTTDPARHTGEGIFFSSRMFDQFSILSGTLFFSCRRPDGEWLIGTDKGADGTLVRMSIATSSQLTTKEIFQRFTTDPDEAAFDRTHIVIGLLAEAGAELVSRSQARRVLSRLGKFKEVVLDFHGVPALGPAFADEIFRVFAATHPEVNLHPIRAIDDVSRMVRRAQNARSAAEAATPDKSTDG